ncbi:hypothetical protein KR009_011144 [Drosophila setifemur]|nr:hypothetical protein KR009_011144 [Drosophila setifemur]
MARKKNPHKKLEVVFDEKKRREFLSGFRKRKNERRSRAKAQLENQLKEERIRIRHEVKEGFKHLKKSFEPLRELTEEDKAEDGEPKQQEETYEDEEVQVKIVELTTNDLTAQRNMLGANRGEESEEEAQPAESESEEEAQTNVIAGMDFDANARKRKKEPEEQSAEPTKKKSTTDPDIKSKKDIDRLMKTRTLNKMHKSKLFKQKELLDRKNQQKKAKRDRFNTIKNVPKHQRKKLKAGFKTTQTKYHKGRMMNRKDLQRKRRGGGD